MVSLLVSEAGVSLWVTTTTILSTHQTIY